MIRKLAVLLLVLAASPAIAAPAQLVRSPGGIEAWLIEDHSVPVVALQFTLRGGSAYDPKDKQGLSELATSLLTEGAGDLDAAAYAERLSVLSSDVGFGAGRDDIYGRVQSLKESLPATLDLLALAMTKPRFDASALDRLKAATLRGLEQRAVDPDSTAYRSWFRLALGGHPYARDPDGTKASVSALTAEDMRAFVRERLHRAGLVVGVAGDVTAAELGPLLDRAFGKLPAGREPAPLPPLEMASKGGVAVIERPVPQSVMVFGEQGLKRSDPDWYAAFVLNQIVGGGVFDARLMDAVRVKAGLAYGVTTGLQPYRAGGLWLGQVSTRNAKAGETVELVKSTWARMATGGPTDAELDEAKRYLTGSFPLTLDSTGAIAAVLVQMQRDGLPRDYLDHRKALLDAVGQADVVRVAKRLMDADRLVFVVVGQPKGIKATLAVPGPG